MKPCQDFCFLVLLAHYYSSPKSMPINLSLTLAAGNLWMRAAAIVPKQYRACALLQGTKILKNHLTTSATSRECGAALDERT